MPLPSQTPHWRRGVLSVFVLRVGFNRRYKNHGGQKRNLKSAPYRSLFQSASPPHVKFG